MKLFDTHFHLYKDDDMNEYFEKAQLAQVEYFVAVGANLEGSEIAQLAAESQENAYFAAGVHPHDANNYIADIEPFYKFKNHNKLVAIGEIGLDYFYDTAPREIQQTIFEEFLGIALEWDLPAIVHCRDANDQDDAYADTYKMLKPFVEKGGHFVIHCFTGTVEWCEKFLELGGYIGFTGIVTFPKGQNVRDVLKIVPNNRLLLETDAPYLAPKPYRGKKNESAYLIEIAKFIATEKYVSVGGLIKMTTLNALGFFKISI